MRIGVDIGGTKVSAVRVDDKHAVLDSSRRPIEADHSTKVVLGNIFEAIGEIWDDRVSGIGVGCAGNVVDGVLTNASNLPSLIGEDIASRVQERFSVPVVVDNDANCFALAEYRLGAGKDASVLVGLTQGTGVGGGIVIDGRVLRGASGCAGELGHLRLLDGSDWESHISGPAIMAEYEELGGVSAEHPGQVWTEDSGPAAATRDHLVEHMGLYLASLVNALNPDMIVLGGGVAKLPDDYYERITDAARPHCVAGARDALSIVRFGISADAGALGAAMLVNEK